MVTAALFGYTNYHKTYYILNRGCIIREVVSLGDEDFNDCLFVQLVYSTKLNIFDFINRSITFSSLVFLYIETVERYIVAELLFNIFNIKVWLIILLQSIKILVDSHPSFAYIYYGPSAE